MSRRRKWLVWIACVMAVGFIALWIAALTLSRRFEPYIREQAVLYLHERFDSDVELAGLRVQMPQVSSLHLLLTRRRGAYARVEGEGIVLRHRGRTDIPAMFRMREFSFEVDLGTLFTPMKIVQDVVVKGMEINIPPVGQRPDIMRDDRDADGKDRAADRGSDSQVMIEEVTILNSTLTILPKDSKRHPLRFEIHRVYLESAGANVAMKYDAALTNAKPPGEILSKGTFGPWVAGEPGDSALAGEYTFDDADLGVFKGIAGILDSNGEFQGTLSSVTVKGQTYVPDFRLTTSDNAVPLRTRFEVLVDGTNGNTVLKPVIGTLGTTTFTTSGGIIRHETQTRRTISLDVSMPNGNLRDLLYLAMKGPPFMEGRISMQTRIDIPPLTGSVREKLQLDGLFEITQGKFLRSTVQDKIDALSRRGQGEPKNEAIDEVVSAMAGRFTLDDQVVTFGSLSFSVPGSGVDLAGSYDLEQDVLDFHGTLRLQAKVSETMTGWKRWVLKPIDPFFAKQGVGTLLRIQVVGSAKDPEFGRDRGAKATAPAIE